MSYRVRLTREAEQDLERLFEFVLERDLERDGGDLKHAEQALRAIKDGVATLSTSPFTCRRASRSPFLRELVIPFGRSGYVALSKSSTAPTSSWRRFGINSKTTITEVLVGSQSCVCRASR